MTPAACVSLRPTEEKRYTGVRSGVASGVRRSHQSSTKRQLPELLSLKECREPCYEMEDQLTELPQDEVQQQVERTSEELDEAEGISDKLTDE